jgi:hypothetical protein
VLIVLLLFGIGGGALFGGGGEFSVPSVHGPIPPGIAARFGDPGGGLPWGMRIVRTPGWTCIQIGRLRGDQLGVLGMYGMYGNDGRFHRYGLGDERVWLRQQGCAPTDGNGRAFLSDDLFVEPASGQATNYGTQGGCAATQVNVPTLPMPGLAYGCPPSGKRLIEAGLLGPDAVSVTYDYDGHKEVERTHGPDGVFLVVGPATEKACAQLPRTACGVEYLPNDSIFGGMVTAVRYSNGRLCQTPTVSQPPERDGKLSAAQLQEQFAALNASRRIWSHLCPKLGYTPASAETDSRVVAPVSYRLIRDVHLCQDSRSTRDPPGQLTTSDESGLYAPCTRALLGQDNGPWMVIHGPVLAVTWDARVPVKSPHARYGVEVASDGCPRIHGYINGAGYVTTGGTISAGERLVYAVPLSGTGYCGPDHGRQLRATVFFEPDLGPLNTGPKLIVGQTPIHLPACVTVLMFAAGFRSEPEPGCNLPYGLYERFERRRSALQ